MIASTRPNVLVLGDPNFDGSAFSEKSLRLIETDVEAISDAALNTSRAILLSMTPPRHSVARQFFESKIQRAFELGLIVGCFSDSIDIPLLTWIRDSTFPNFIRTLEPGMARFVFHSQLEELATSFLHHDPGPPLGTAEIFNRSSRLLTQQEETLLKRAFFDYDQLVVQTLSGGVAATGTFRVYATQSHLRQHPMPFFVKIETPRNAAAERNHYQENAEPFIPFYLRPALNSTRCVVGSEESALVCNFVEGAVGLREAIRTGQAAGVLFSLFETTLRALRGKTVCADAQPQVLATFITERARASEIPTHHSAFARTFHILRSATEIESELLALAEDIKSRRGTYHGDLHAGNVMVRHRDAIVIDFGSMSNQGPLAADPSNLEISLVFGTDEKDNSNSFSGWRQFVDYVYPEPDGRVSSFLAPPRPLPEHDIYSHLCRALREIRHVLSCCSAIEQESAIVFIASLLRFARLRPMLPPTSNLYRLAEEKHAYALVVADRLLRWIVPVGARNNFEI